MFMGGRIDNERSCAAVVIAAGALLLVPASGHCDGGQESAAQLASDCEPYRHAAIERQVEGGSIISVTPTLTSSFCWGFFSVIQQTDRLLGLCLPVESSRLELIKV